MPVATPGDGLPMSTHHSTNVPHPTDFGSEVAAALGDFETDRTPSQERVTGGPRSDRAAPPPLLITADDDLLSAVLPLAAAADVTPAVASDAAAALACWRQAPVVLVGTDLAGAVAEIGPLRRAHVYVIGNGRQPDDIFRLALRLGARQVVELPISDGWLVELLTDLTEERSGLGRVIGVIGGTGGAGATTFACALGQRAAQLGETAIIDCDPQGPGLDRMLGMERREGFRWDALCSTTGRLSARALREALPRTGKLGVLSWYVGAEPQTLQAFAVREALSAARRGHDTVIVDLPRTPDPLIDEIVARCDRLVVATAGSVIGVAGAARMRARFGEHPDTGLLLRGEALSESEVAAAVRLPVFAQMRDQRGIDESVDLGLGPLRSRRGPLARAVDAVLAVEGA